MHFVQEREIPKLVPYGVAVGVLVNVCQLAVVVVVGNGMLLLVASTNFLGIANFKVLM